MFGQIFTAEVLEHAGLDRRVVALKIKERLDQINIDRAKSRIENDRVGQFTDQLVDSPLVASASPLSQEIGGIHHLEDAGASAVVLYSLFEIGRAHV